MPRTPTFLRNNWPLLAAGMLLILGGIYSFAALPLEGYGIENSLIIYPLVAFSSATVRLFFLSSLLMLIILRRWARRKPSSQKLYIGLVLFALSSALYQSVTLKTPVFIIMTAFIVVTAVIVVVFDSVIALRVPETRSRPMLQAISVTLLANLFACSSCSSFAFNGLDHRQSLRFNGRVYNLALRIDDDLEDQSRIVTVYECDSLGIVCKQHGLEVTGYAFKAITIPDDIKLFIENNALYLDIDDKTELITQ